MFETTKLPTSSARPNLTPPPYTVCSKCCRTCSLRVLVHPDACLPLIGFVSEPPDSRGEMAGVRWGGRSAGCGCIPVTCHPVHIHTLAQKGHSPCWRSKCQKLYGQTLGGRDKVWTCSSHILGKPPLPRSYNPSPLFLLLLLLLLLWLVCFSWV